MSYLNIDVHLLRKDFELQVQCSVEKGIVGVFGPSGSGKTSLLHLISGIETHGTGRILLNNKPLLDTTENIFVPVNKRRIGYVFQEGRLFPHLCVEQNLQYGISSNRDSKGLAIDIGEVVELLNIGDVLSKSISKISGGQRQRVALGRALLTNPLLLLLDEPFSNLDVHLRKQIIPYLRRITDKFKIPALVVSHDLPDLLRLTNRLIILSDGKLLGCDAFQKLIVIPRIFPLFDASGILNNMEMSVINIHAENALLELGNEAGIRIFAEMATDDHYSNDDRISVSLRPQDITLAKNRVDDISIRNQLKGRLTNLIEMGNKMICLVDIGTDVIVEITKATYKGMKLVKGMEIWCLFKAASLNTLKID